MFKTLKPANTPAEMRAAIEEARRDHAVIHNCLTMSEIHNMDAEDAYTMLAYHAMQALIQTRSDYLKTLSTMPPRPMVIKKPA